MTAKPQPPIYVYLRGQGMPQDTWDRVEAAMHKRGWHTVRFRTTAWHLARGGVPVVMVDFSVGLDRSKGAWRGYDLFVRVGRVRARYEETIRPGRVEDLLTTTDLVRLARAGRPAWFDEQVEVIETELALPMLHPVEVDRPYRQLDDGRWGLDEDELAELVAQVIG